MRDGEEPPFHYGIIVSAMRKFTEQFSEYFRSMLGVHRYSDHKEVYSMASLELAQAAVLARDRYGLPVVGFDLAGEEAGYPAEAHRQAFELVHKNFMMKTVHAGEAYGPESIFQAITELYADRIGHGTYLLDESFPEVRDINRAHVNGLAVSAEGEVLLSLYAFDAVVSVDGDPASPTFLQMLWHASGAPGDGDDLPDPDYIPPVTAFQAQHNASRVGDALWIFDNQSRMDARALRLRMDHVAGTIVEERAWSLDRRCANQGGAIPIEGGVLATCANSREVFQFLEDEEEAAWTLEASCPGGHPLSGFTRAHPVIIE